MYSYYDSYKDAISYNNVGIQHMKMKDYVEANRCFQIALRNVKSIVEIEKTSSNDEFLKRVDVDKNVVSCTRSNDNDNDWNDYLSSDTMTIMTTDNSLSSSTSFSESTKNKDKITLFRPLSIQLPTLDIESIILLCGGDDTIQLERCTAIILYNIATCHIVSIMENNITDNTSLSSLMALKVLTLSLNVIQETLSRIDIINDDTIQTWYGIHQLEYRVLIAMIYLFKYRNQNHNNDNVIHDGDDSNKNIVKHQDYVSECIMDRIQNVQTILLQYHNTIYFLCSLSASSTNTAPCA